MNTDDVRGSVEVKFHQSKEIPNLLEDNQLLKLYKSTYTLRLEAGREYFIDVKPHMVKTTQAFKNMNFKERKCKLHDEVEKNSIFKVYTMQNCKYECHIKGPIIYLIAGRSLSRHLAGALMEHFLEQCALLRPL